MLENLRFHRGEEANDARFAARLARLADVYVNEAFGTAHRAHASTEGVAHLLPAAAGLLLERELEQLTGVVGVRGQKSGVVSGGAKISDKLPLLMALTTGAKCLCLGGAMANTFLLAQGMAVGASLVEPEMLEAARDVLANAEKAGCAVCLPVDGVIAQGPAQPPRARPVVFANEPVPRRLDALGCGAAHRGDLQGCAGRDGRGDLERSLGPCSSGRRSPVGPGRSRARWPDHPRAPLSAAGKPFRP